jgi:hypothetical protein
MPARKTGRKQMIDRSTEQVLGLLARFDNPTSLAAAAENIRQAGYTRFDCHSPFPIHGLDKAMGLTRSRLGWLVGLAALVGTSGALALQWWTSSVDYPLVISGKPFFSFQAYVPVTFALGVLLSAVAALVGMLAINGLPRFHHPVFYSDRFTRASDDGFFVSIEAADSNFDPQATAAFLEAIGGHEVEVLKRS